MVALEAQNDFEWCCSWWMLVFAIFSFSVVVAATPLSITLQWDMGIKKYSLYCYTIHTLCMRWRYQSSDLSCHFHNAAIFGGSIDPQLHLFSLKASRFNLPFSHNPNTSILYLFISKINLIINFNKGILLPIVKVCDLTDNPSTNRWDYSFCSIAKS